MEIQIPLFKLCRYIENRGYAGFDPYDALNSSLIQTLSLQKKIGRIFWIQIFRRLPFNLRALFFLPEGINPKGIGLFLEGYNRLHQIGFFPGEKAWCAPLFALLVKTMSKGYSGSCWGYNFDWQSRAFYVPKYTPTIVNTAFIGHALLDVWKTQKEQKFLDMVVSCSDFLLKDLNRKIEGETFCFSYTPVDNTAVHNANMLGASLLIRLFSKTGEEKLRDAALASLAYSMKYQHDDGSWFYAETQMQSWIDSFHTGFNLEALRWFIKLGHGEEYIEDYRKGVEYYAANFFLGNGAPKYYHNKLYPIDIHAPAEAIYFFSGEGIKYQDLVERVLTWLLNNMWDEEKGYFYFRKGKYFTNKIPYMRWSQAWAFRALTEYAKNYGRQHGNI